MTTHGDFEELFAHQGHLARFARSLVRDPNTADDLVQETWLVAMRHRMDARHPRSWLRTILRNKAVELHRSSTARQDRERLVAAREDTGPDPVQPEELACAQLRSALKRLTERDREVLLLRHGQSLSWSAIAARLGVPSETARTRYKRALARVRARLDQRSPHWRASLLCLFEAPQVPPHTGAPARPGPAAGLSVKIGATVLAGGLLALAVAHPLDQTAPSSALPASPGRDSAQPRIEEVETALALPPPSRVKTPGQPPEQHLRTELPRSPAGTVRVRGRAVLSRGGRPVEGATIWVSGAAGLRRERALCSTDREGRFELASVEVGLWICATAPGLGESKARYLGDPSLGLDGLREVSLELLPGSPPVEGVVLDARGHGVPHARVAALAAPSIGPGSGSRGVLWPHLTPPPVTADETGRFSLQLPRQTYLLQASSPSLGVAFDEVLVKVDKRPTEPAVLRFGGGATVAGRAKLPDGAPAGGAALRLVVAGVETEVLARADDEGRFELRGVPQDAAVVASRTGSSARLEPRPFEPERQRSWNPVLLPDEPGPGREAGGVGELRGTFELRGEQAHLLLRRTGAAQPRPVPLDANGAFRIEDLEAGDVELIALFPNSHQVPLLELRLREHERRDVGALRLPGGGLDVEVEGRFGLARLYDAEGRHLQTGPAPPDGWLRYGALPAGVYRVVIGGVASEATEARFRVEMDATTTGRIELPATVAHSFVLHPPDRATSGRGRTVRFEVWKPDERVTARTVPVPRAGPLVFKAALGVGAYEVRAISGAWSSALALEVEATAEGSVVRSFPVE